MATTIKPRVRIPSLAFVVTLIAVASLTPATSAEDPCRPDPAAYESGGRPKRAAVVDDPLFQQQWGLRQLNVPEAWSQGALGRGALIAVIDSGVDQHHPDLRSNLVKGVDLAGEGEPDDCPGPQDRGGHGTHVAGIAAAVGDNAIGIVGVAPEARVMAIQVLHGDEGLDQILDVSRRVAEGVRYAADHDADVINISLDSFFVADPPATGISGAIEYAWGKGVVVVAAAGNDDLPFCNYPGGDVLAICVGATDRQGEVTPYSNDPAKPTDDTAVLGPGGNDLVGGKCETRDLVWSTYLPADWDCGTGGYATLGGTSMASPAVAGVAALLSGMGLDNREIVECLLTTSSNGGTYDRSTGYGIVDAGKAVETCA